MKSLFRNSAAALLLLCIIAPQSARASVVFDFVGYAASLGEHGPFTGTTESGITVVISANLTYSPYLDGVSGGLPAGLGVCKILVGTQCSPSSDDNVTAGETLTLAFFDSNNNPLTVILDPTFFRNADHGTSYPAGALIDIGIDGAVAVAYTLQNNFTTPLQGSVFEFAYNNDQFYISSTTVSPVPLPAALPLLLSALAGLGMFGWRRRRAAA